jgi:UPF0755 protein
VLAIVVAVVFALPHRRHSGVGRAVDVEIPAGASEAETIARLEAAGVIDRGPVLDLYLRTHGGLAAKPGRHLLSDDLSLVEVVRRLQRSPDVARVKVTFPEGFNRFDIAKRLRDKRICDDKAFLDATIDKSLLDELQVPYGDVVSAEGWLFPATYELPADAEPAEVVRRMVGQAKDRIKKLSEGKQTPLDVRQSVILASIVEKEAVVDDERPIIASVFLNRMRDTTQTGGRLEADPTAMYGCWAGSPPTPLCVTWLALGTTKPTAPIEHDEFNPWCTYTHAGLPPTPIANPSEKSLAAAFAPATTKYFYFVAKGGGRHTFSETLSAHQKATH